MGQLANSKNERPAVETRESFLSKFHDEMRRLKARSPQEVLVRGMWLQSLADFQAGQIAGAARPDLALSRSVCLCVCVSVCGRLIVCSFQLDVAYFRLYVPFRKEVAPRAGAVGEPVAA